MRTLLTIGTVLLLTVPAVRTQQRSVDDFFHTATDEWMRMHPTRAATTKYFTGPEQAGYERQFTPGSLEFQASEAAFAKRTLAQLRQFNRPAMTAGQQLSADIMAWQLEAIVRQEPYSAILSFPLNQFDGANVTLVETLTVNHAIGSLQDAENYVARLQLVDVRMDEAIERAVRISEQGVIPPRFIVEATLRQMREFIASPPERNPLVTSFVERMAAVPAIAADRREALRRDAQQIVEREVYPAWRRSIVVLEGQSAKATNDAGIWRLKDGDKAYRTALHLHTTTDLTPDEIHAIGLRQVATLEAEADRLLRQIGRTEGTVKARLDVLKIDMQYPQPQSEASRAQIMVDIEAMIADAQRRSEALFDLRPKSPVLARPFPAFREGNAAANYNGPAPDGSRPGTFQFPRRLDQMTKFGLRSIVYHETIPGHHFQVGLQIENASLPKFRSLRAFGGLAAFSEGWGLYAERLAAESGWYDDDIAGRLGQLNYELFRARRLVVDTGIHAKHWTRQQAIDYGIDPSEVERYVTYPGQACSYMVGELKLIELRDRMIQARGTPSAIREFHNLVLRMGAVPLQILEQEVGTAIAVRPAR